MKLRNPFSTRVRDLWFMCWECVVCSGNGTDCGGLELHHIAGRVSGSALNAATVCKGCHIGMGHSESEEKMLFREVLSYYYNGEIELTKEDVLFVDEYSRLKDVTNECNEFTQMITLNNQSEKNN